MFAGGFIFMNESAAAVTRTSGVSSSIYADIAERTGGDIYIGVVGPVRTGKSTFIKKFMETLVLPNIADAHEKERARDEMPQSAAGRTVMTTEPKFVPDEAVSISMSDNASMRVKMVDCVGYIVPDALGHVENGGPRMVNTPWSEEPMPFENAAEIGTRKVICDHSTVGVVVTTDGTVGEIPRQNYVEAEGRVIKELKAMNKPFVIVINSSMPENEESIRMALAAEEKYGVPVALVNCLELNGEDIRHILEMLLLEFPVKEIGVELPTWMSALDPDYGLVVSVREAVLKAAESVSKTGDIHDAFVSLSENEFIKSASVTKIDLGTGKAVIDVKLEDGLYYKTIGELTGLEITDDVSLVNLLGDLSATKKKYDKVASALEDVERSGYGIVTPEIADLRLEEPEIIKQPGGYGVKLRAGGPSIHMIKADIETEINPIVGTASQSEDLVKFLMKEFEGDPTKIWDSNIFGKTLHELVNEGLHAKLSHMPEDARMKLSETLQRIINEGSGGLICIIL